MCIRDRLSDDSNTPQRKVDLQWTNDVQKRLQTHLRPKFYGLWFKSIEVVESINDLTEIRLNSDEIGYHHINDHYLNDLKTIIATEVKLTI